MNALADCFEDLTRAWEAKRPAGDATDVVEVLRAHAVECGVEPAAALHASFAFHRRCANAAVRSPKWIADWCEALIAGERRSPTHRAMEPLSTQGASGVLSIVDRLRSGPESVLRVYLRTVPPGVPYGDAEDLPSSSPPHGSVRSTLVLKLILNRLERGEGLPLGGKGGRTAFTTPPASTRVWLWYRALLNHQQFGRTKTGPAFARFMDDVERGEPGAAAVRTFWEVFESEVPELLSSYQSEIAKAPALGKPNVVALLHGAEELRKNAEAVCEIPTRIERDVLDSFGAYSATALLLLAGAGFLGRLTAALRRTATSWGTPFGLATGIGGAAVGALLVLGSLRGCGAERTLDLSGLAGAAGSAPIFGAKAGPPDGESADIGASNQGGKSGATGRPTDGGATSDDLAYRPPPTTVGQALGAGDFRLGFASWLEADTFLTGHNGTLWCHGALLGSTCALTEAWCEQSWLYARPGPIRDSHTCGTIASRSSEELRDELERSTDHTEYEIGFAVSQEWVNRSKECQHDLAVAERREWIATGCKPVERSMWGDPGKLRVEFSQCAAGACTVHIDNHADRAVVAAWARYIGYVGIRGMMQTYDRRDQSTAPPNYLIAILPHTRFKDPNMGERHPQSSLAGLEGAVLVAPLLSYSHPDCPRGETCRLVWRAPADIGRATRLVKPEVQVILRD